MIQYFFFLAIGVGALVALVDWRKGLLLMLIAGALQDPVRKIMSDTPAYMVLAFLPIWFAICISVLFGGLQGWHRFMANFPALRVRILAFMSALFLAGLVLFVKHGLGVWKVGVIGFIGYAFPILTLVVGFHYCREGKRLRRLLAFYCVFTSLFLAGALLEYYGLFPDWSALGTASLGMQWIRHIPGVVIPLVSGFSRSPDIMGWHAAMLVMLSLALAHVSRSVPFKAGWLLLAIWGAAILLISGRNKMIFMPVVFVGSVGLLYVYRGGLGKAVSLLVAAIIVAGLFLALNQRLAVNEAHMQYASFGASDITSRLTKEGYGTVIGTFRQSGFFGEGLGSASTGARHGGKGSIRTWQESGLSKLLVELGIVGVVAVMFVAATLFKTLKLALDTLRTDSQEYRLFVSLLAVLVANMTSFLVSHQVFGDPFIVIFAGFLLGILMSIAHWPGQDWHSRQSARLGYKTITH